MHTYSKCKQPAFIRFNSNFDCFSLCVPLWKHYYHKNIIKLLLCNCIISTNCSIWAHLIEDYSHTHIPPCRIPIPSYTKDLFNAYVYEMMQFEVLGLWLVTVLRQSKFHFLFGLRRSIHKTSQAEREKNRSKWRKERRRRSGERGVAVKGLRLGAVFVGETRQQWHCLPLAQSPGLLARLQS